MSSASMYESEMFSVQYNIPYSISVCVGEWYSRLCLSPSFNMFDCSQLGFRKWLFG